jgi:hypothetical protein
MSPLPDTLDRVSEQELQQLISDLNAWCSKKHGRVKEIATAMEVREDTVSHWLGNRRRPSLRRFFALKAFLEQQAK